MSVLILSSAKDRRREAVAAQAAGEQALLPMLRRAVVVLVEESFRYAPCRTITRSEVQRRVGIVRDHHRCFVEVLGWSFERSVSHLRIALRSALAGIEYVPPADDYLYAPDEALLHAIGFASAEADGTTRRAA